MSEQEAITSGAKPKLQLLLNSFVLSGKLVRTAKASDVMR
jgi:hypothetical protein